MSVIIGSTIAGTVQTSTGLPYQNHLFWAVNDRAWWLLYVDSTDKNKVKTYRSPDGVNWTAQSSVACALVSSLASVIGPDAVNSRGDHVGACYKNISGNDVVHVQISASSTSATDAQYVRATISGGSITWGTPTEYDNVSLTGATAAFCGVLIDANNRPIHSSQTYSAHYGLPGVDRATNTDNGSSWTGGFGATVGVGSTAQTGCIPLTDLGSGNILVAYTYNNVGGALINIEWNKWNGSAWSGNGALVFGSNLPPNQAGFTDWDAITLTTSDTHLVVSTNGSNVFQHWRFNGTSWSAGAAIPNQAYKEGTHLALSTDGTNLWAIIIDSTASNAVKFIKWSGASGNWDGAWSTLESSTQTRTNITSSQNLDASGNIGVTWTQVNGSNFDVVFTTIPTTGFVTTSQTIQVKLIDPPLPSYEQTDGKAFSSSGRTAVPIKAPRGIILTQANRATRLEELEQGRAFCQVGKVPVPLQPKPLSTVPAAQVVPSDYPYGDDYRGKSWVWGGSFIGFSLPMVTIMQLSAFPMVAALFAEVDFTALVLPTEGFQIPTGNVLFTNLTNGKFLGDVILDFTGTAFNPVISLPGNELLQAGNNVIKANYAPDDTQLWQPCSATISVYVFEGVNQGTVILSTLADLPGGLTVVQARVGRKDLKMWSRAALIATDPNTLITSPLIMHQSLTSEYVHLVGYEGPILAAFPDATTSAILGLPSSPIYWVLPFPYTVSPAGYDLTKGSLTFIEQFE